MKLEHIWECLQEQWQWIAEDLDGSIYLFTQSPNLHNTSWDIPLTDYQDKYLRINEILAIEKWYIGDWSSSVARRPRTKQAICTKKARSLYRKSNRARNRRMKAEAF